VSGVSDNVTTATDNTCDKVPGAAVGPTQTQIGSGSDDGVIYNANRARQEVMSKPATHQAWD